MYLTLRAFPFLNLLREASGATFERLSALWGWGGVEPGMSRGWAGDFSPRASYKRLRARVPILKKV